MRAIAFLLLLAGTTSGQIGEGAARIAEVQARLPWFWSPPLEGFYEIPYVFESNTVYHAAKRPPLTLRLERVPMLGGIYNRCLAQNGAPPCSPGMLKVYDQANQANEKGGAFPPEQRAAVREHRRDFWIDFPKAFRFEPAGSDGFRFRPTGAYQPKPGSQTELLASIRGELRFDAQTYEITAFEYEVLKDVSIPGRQLPKGTKFAVRLTKSADGHYLPATLSFDAPSAKGRVLEEIAYSNYRRFAVDSAIQFGDPPSIP